MGTAINAFVAGPSDVAALSARGAAPAEESAADSLLQDPAPPLPTVDEHPAGPPSWPDDAGARCLVIGFGLVYLSQLAAIGSIDPRSFVVLGCWALAGVVLSVRWSELLQRQAALPPEQAAQQRGHVLALCALSLLLGLYGSLPLALLHGEVTPSGLAACTALSCVLVLFASASAGHPPGSLHLFAAASLLPLAAAWALGSPPGQAWDALSVIAVAWALSVLLHARLRVQADATWRVRRECERHDEALQERNRLLQALHASRGRVLSTASHEIRQPVHALGLLIERLRVDPQARPLRDQVDEMAGVVDSLAHGLELLLDISRLEAGTVRVNRGAVMLDDLLARICAEQEPMARRKGLRLSCDAPARTAVLTDPHLMRAIVSNFVSNAIRYTDHGEVRVRVAARGDDDCWIEVVDTGCGIAASMHEAIFREYVRLDRESQSAQGFGLGLAIVRRTAQLLGATVEVESTPGRGSCFRVSVPRLKGPGAARPEAPPPSRSGASASRSLVGLRALLVDNDPVVLRGTEAMVRTWGCLPLVSTSVFELEAKLAHLGRDDIDFVIADLHLNAGSPDGLDAIGRVRQRAGRFVPAVLLTGDVNVRPAKVDLPNVHVLYKPVSPAKLRAMIDVLVDERRHGGPLPPAA